MTPQEQAVVEALEELIRAEHRLRGRRKARARLAVALEADRSLHNVWLTLAVILRGLPIEAEVRSAHRRLVSDGSAALLRQLARTRRPLFRTVQLMHDAVIVDVRHTSETDLATGIQRVARETVRRWESTRDITLVTWTNDGRAMRKLLPAEHATAIHAKAPIHGSTRAVDRHIIIPIGGTYILPELAAELWRTERLTAMGAFGHLLLCVIGFDCVPLTTAETVGEKMPAAFARNLVAVGNMDKLAAISEAAAVEYRGWRRMLSASGIHGPDIRNVLLAAESGTSTEADEEELEALVGTGPGPLVLVVGSHEPRKNHAAVLHAAELAWSAGHEFRLVFVGGNSWSSLHFTDQVAILQQRGRHIVSISALPDNLLWAAYRRARFTVFTSINEGFGLPVAESLASGTPVITSNFGSMKELASTGGAVVVDPRNDDDIANGIVQLLANGPFYDRLRDEAAQYRVRPWDDYASDLWQYFVSSDIEESS